MKIIHKIAFGFILLILLSSSVKGQDDFGAFIFSEKLKEGDSFQWKINSFSLNDSFTGELNNSMGIAEGATVTINIIGNIAAKELNTENMESYDIDNYFEADVDGKQIVWDKYTIFPQLEFSWTEKGSITSGNETYEYQSYALYTIPLILPTSIRFANGTILQWSEFYKQLASYDESVTFEEDDTSFTITGDTGEYFKMSKETGVLIGASISSDAFSIDITLQEGFFAQLSSPSWFFLPLVPLALLVNRKRRH